MLRSLPMIGTSLVEEFAMNGMSHVEGFAHEWDATC